VNPDAFPLRSLHILSGFQIVPAELGQLHTRFPHLEALSIRGFMPAPPALILQASDLAPLFRNQPNLTHLDLGCSEVSDLLLDPEHLYAIAPNLRTLGLVETLIHGHEDAGQGADSEVPPDLDDKPIASTESLHYFARHLSRALARQPPIDAGRFNAWAERLVVYGPYNHAAHHHHITHSASDFRSPIQYYHKARQGGYQGWFQPCYLAFDEAHGGSIIEWPEMIQDGLRVPAVAIINGRYYKEHPERGLQRTTLEQIKRENPGTTFVDQRRDHIGPNRPTGDARFRSVATLDPD
jgi:hypothetical protein